MFYVLKVLKDSGVHIPSSLVIGNVEFRSPKTDYPNELAVIKISVKENKSNIMFEVNSRIGTIVDAETEEDAKNLANANYIDALDIMSSELPLSEIELSDCGYIKNLETGQLNALSDVPFPPSISFINETTKFKKIEFSQWLTSQDTELAKRYRRSLHWSRSAKWERNVQIRILFHWFSVEALFKEEEEDNIGSLIRWFLGYPNGRSAQHVSQELIMQLQANNLYVKWKRKLISSLEEIREFRNCSVHQGFRHVDFPRQKLLLFDQIMVYGCTRSQGAVQKSLQKGIKTTSEFKEYKGVIFEENVDLINDIHGIVLYSLEAKYGTVL